jgi:hypothetical protein
MESPREVHESKSFRWVGHLSEEELLGGPPASLSPMRSVSFQPQRLSAPARSPLSALQSADPLAVPPRWRFEVRDLIALAAVAAAVWFALRGSDGLPFRSSEPVEPASATEFVTASVGLDRQELSSLPRGTNAANASPGSASGHKGSTQGGGGSGSNDKPKPPPDETSTPPPLQATVPGVGTVTVNQPDVPDLPVETPSVPLPDLPSLPGTGGVLPQTPTVSVP